MRDLRFEGLSDDGTRLVLVGKDGQRWSVVIDERMEAAVRRDRARLGQVEIEQSGELRPREIRARIRAGATAEDVAAASGLPLEKIKRYEGPVLTKRAWIAQQAGLVPMRRPTGDISLAELVTARLGDQGVPVEDINWDAWQPDDGPWTVIATFPLGPNMHVATWQFDAVTRTVTAVDDNAEDLSAPSAPTKLRLITSRPQLAAVTEPDRPAHDADRDADDAPVASLPGPAAQPHDPDEGSDGSSTFGVDAPDPLAAATPDEQVTAGIAQPESPSEAPIAGVAPIDAASRPTPRNVRRAGKRVTRHPSGSALPPNPVEPVEPLAVDKQEAPLFEAPEGKAKPGRSAVPSFDDILFGPAPKH
jgi:hypothetical protein